jgi:CRP/FNR family cyclic AMP-dependent transcriptional regulator
MQTLKPVLEQQKFFSGLTPEHLDLLTGCARQARFAQGEFLFHMGDPADAFYLIRHGRVALEVFTGDRGALSMMTASEDDVVGWSWIVPPYVWELDARAVAPTLALKFDGACLRGKCEADHELGYQIYRRFVPIIASRLQATRLQVLDVHRSA